MLSTTIIDPLVVALLRKMPEAVPGVVNVVEVLALLKFQILFPNILTAIFAIPTPETLVPLVVVLLRLNPDILFDIMVEVVVPPVLKTPSPANPAVDTVAFVEADAMSAMVLLLMVYVPADMLIPLKLEDADDEF